MSRRPTIDALLTQCDEQGIFVREIAMPPDWEGAYHRPSSTIYLRAGMCETDAVPTLMHELEHAARRDDGHQAPSVEARIDRAVACRLITPGEYAAAEAVAGHYSGAIAAELGLPRWVVSAYRQTLRLERPAPR